MPPPAVPLPLAPPPALQAHPGILSADRWIAPTAPPLADLVPQGPVMPPLAMTNPFDRALPLPVQFEDTDPVAVVDAAPAALEKPVAPDDDCVPVEPPVVKPKVVKRSVFAEGAAKPRGKSFSEQVDAARKRVAPPAVVQPRQASDC